MGIGASHRPGGYKLTKWDNLKIWIFIISILVVCGIISWGVIGLAFKVLT